MIVAPDIPDAETLIDRLLAEQRQLTAVEKFGQLHARQQSPQLEAHYRDLIPLNAPRPGEQFAFEVNLDKCSGCKGCVAACHSLNGLDEGEAWREVGALFGEAIVPQAGGGNRVLPIQQTVTTACHHCVEPGCLLGCPVLAYDKDPVTGIVRHLDDQCIGCSYCILKCPYDVPKYSAKRGIVRKCDMCHDRLAVGEAPACVQACPHEAIRITVVEQQTVRMEFSGAAGGTNKLSSKFQVPGSKEGSNAKIQECGSFGGEPNQGLSVEVNGSHEVIKSFQSVLARIGIWPLELFWNWELGTGKFRLRPQAKAQWLSDAPSPAITLPTTRYVSAKPIGDLRAADHFNPKPSAAHWPLVLMLVLTQAGMGGLLASAFAQPIGGVRWPGLVSFALLNAGLLASVFHLGQPRKAWRVWLGWRTSWLSREAITLNVFCGAAAAFLAAQWLTVIEGIKSSFVSALVVLAMMSLFAQMMVYVDTRRHFWRLSSTAPRFLGTTMVLGLASQLVVQPEPAIAIGLMLATLFKLAFELRVFKPLDSDEVCWTQLRRTAVLQAGVLRPVFGARLMLGVCGGVALPLAVLAGTPAQGWIILGAAMCFGAELAERYLFFTSVSPDKMPGQP